VLFLCLHAIGATVAWSPDHRRYAADSPGQQVGKGQERERLEIFDEKGKQIAVAHVWLVEPDGTNRAGIRGCESWGWVDSAPVFYQGTADPDSGVYLVFDARRGRELQESIGTGFVWSPHHASIANVGDARVLGTVSENSDSIEVEGKLVFPSQKDSRLHWFRSPLVRSPDSHHIAVADFPSEAGIGAFDRRWSCRRRLRAESGLAGGGRRLAAAISFSVQWVEHQITANRLPPSPAFTLARAVAPTQAGRNR